MTSRLVHRFPLTAFFTLAYGLSWLAWIPFVLGDSGLNVLDLHVPRLGGSAQLVGLLPGAYLGPVTAAFIVTATVSGRDGLRHWSRRLVKFKVNWRWYAVVLLGVPATILLSTFVLPESWGNARMIPAWVAAAYLPMLILQFFTTAMAEEPGWRDFALPRLQERFGAVGGTTVLGLLWGGWHLPLFFSEWGGWPNTHWLSPIEFVACCVPLSLVMTWVFNRTGQSLPIVMILHAGINSTYSLVWHEVFPTLDPVRDPLHTQLICSTVLALILIVATRGKLGLDVRPAPVAVSARV